MNRLAVLARSKNIRQHVLIQEVDFSWADSKALDICVDIKDLNHWGLNKMVIYLQTTFLNVFSSVKKFEL